MSQLTRTNIRLAFWTLALGMLIAVWGSFSGDLNARAQVAGDEAPAAEAPAAEAPAAEAPAADVLEDSQEKKPESLGELIFVKTEWFGLIFYIALGIFSLVALAITFERMVNLRRGKVMPGHFLSSLSGLVQRGDDTLENLRNLCESSAAPVASILKAGVLRAGRPLPEVEKAMEDAADREMAAMRGRNRALSVIGSVAPLLGLLGTVVGMIFAFRVSSQAGLGKAELLAEGIYLALMTTAAGLTIAIPCLLLVAWFNALVERYMREIDESLLETMPAFTRMENTK